MTMKLKFIDEISSQRMADMLCSAIECNDMTTSWCNGLYVADDVAEKFKITSGPFKGCGWYVNPEFWDSDYSIKVIHDTGDEGEGALDGTTIITPVEVRAGFELMRRKFSKHYYDMINERGDSITSDVMLQCIVLKDVVFG
jgi:hypothetical protein